MNNNECTKHQLVDRDILLIKKFKELYCYRNYMESHLKTRGYSDDEIEYYISEMAINMARNPKIKVNDYEEFLINLFNNKLLKRNYNNLLFKIKADSIFNFIDLFSDPKYKEIIISILNIQPPKYGIGKGEFLFDLIFKINKKFNGNGDFILNNQLIELKVVKDKNSSATVAHFISPIKDKTHKMHKYFSFSEKKFNKLMNEFDKEEVSKEMSKIWHNILPESEWYNILENDYAEFKKELIKPVIRAYQKYAKWEYMIFIDKNDLNTAIIKEPMNCTKLLKIKKICLSDLSKIYGVDVNLI